MAFSFVFGDELPSWCILKCMREQDHFLWLLFNMHIIKKEINVPRVHEELNFSVTFECKSTNS